MAKIKAAYNQRIENVSSIVRNDTMENRDYLVVPMIMLTEGVHNGSQGPILYTAEELSKFPGVWNHKPVVVYHPQKEGQPISACDPAVLTAHKIGVIMNTKFEDGKLKAEAWLDIERVNAVDNRILEAINNNETLELSTGLVTDTLDVPGEWNGETYTSIAVNFKPDHLAVLPDMVGACSIADGAGFLRLNTEEGQLIINMSKLNKEQQRFLKELKPKSLFELSQAIQNEISFDDTRQLLYSKLSESIPNEDTWIIDVFDEYFIYERNGTFKKQSYSITDGKVSFDDIAVDVEKKVSYETISNLNNERNIPMDEKAKLIKSLIDNQTTSFVKEDEVWLQNLELEQLKKLEPIANEEPAASEPEKPKKKKVTSNKAEKDEDEQKEETKVTANEETKKPQTVQEFISNAPSEMQEIFNEAMNARLAERKRLTNIITANEKNIFDEAALNSMKIEQLRAVAALAVKDNQKIQNQQILNYSAQADVIDNSSAEEALELPVLNFETKDKK